MFCRSGGVDIITVDSVAALVPRAELDKDIGDPTVGLQARMMSAGLRRIAASASRTGTTVVFINQLRMKIGVMFGNPEVHAGASHETEGPVASSTTPPRGTCAALAAVARSQLTRFPLDHARWHGAQVLRQPAH